MKKLLSPFINILFLCCLSIASYALETPWQKVEYTNIRLIAGENSAQPGQPLTLGIEFNLDEHWHIYWQNAGDSGLPAQITFTNLPKNTHISDINWPEPKLIPVDPLMNYGYEGNVILPLTLTIPSTYEAHEPLNIGAKIDFLMCYDICLPGSATFNLKIPIATQSPPIITNEHTARINAQTYPALISQQNITVASTSDVITLDIPSSLDYTSPRFIPLEEGYINDFAPQKWQNDVLTIQRDTWNNKATAGLNGIIIESTPHTLTDDMNTRQESAITHFFIAALFALLAGLLLNLMPCVLPMIALKVFGLIQHAHGKVFKHTVAFSLGILSLFWLIAGSIMLLQQAGIAIGWGFHLQNAYITAGLCLLLVVISLNFFGVFEIGNSIMNAAGRVDVGKGYMASFLTGALITLIATPCTIPFMSTAVTYALTSSSAILMFTIFTLMGVGLALPYLMLAAHPAWLKKLPKPGKWLTTFKQLLGFPMIATAVWLLWVHNNQTNSQTLLVLTLAVILAFSFWLFGKLQFHKPRLALFIVLVSILGVIKVLTMAAIPAKESIAWQAWSPEYVKELTEQNMPIFVDFTADWCVTCKVTEATVINRNNMKNLFAKYNVIPLKADWTNYDPAITAALAEHNRKGVPLYLLYLPNTEKPVVLPQLVSYGKVKQALTHSRP